MKLETMLEKAKEVSPAFFLYAQYMLEEFPEMNMPTLRDCFKHNATTTEYRAHMDRIKQGGQHD